MEIRCKSTKRFLMSINIEKYISDIKDMGLKMETPLIIEIPCRSCRCIEVYEIYETHYKFISAYKKN